jgi:DNA-binding CsgD family transcriptional regulator
MVTEKIKELEATKAKMADLVKAIESERNKELRSLPEKYGFDNVNEFLAAMKSAFGRKGARKAPAARRARAVITEDTRAQVKKLVAAGKTGSEIAEAVGISLPSVQNIKKALGLVKPR